jgi:hypothetical protein
VDPYEDRPDHIHVDFDWPEPNPITKEDLERVMAKLPIIYSPRETYLTMASYRDLAKIHTLKISDVNGT